MDFFILLWFIFLWVLKLGLIVIVCIIAFWLLYAGFWGIVWLFVTVVEFFMELKV